VVAPVQTTVGLRLMQGSEVRIHQKMDYWHGRNPEQTDEKYLLHKT
jgi:hypothetical protein